MPTTRDVPAFAPVRRELLLWYRGLAFATATLLIVLVFAGIPLQVGEGNAAVVNDVGTLHGFLYLAYLVVAFRLTRRLGVPKWQMVLVLLAGTVPFCAFVAERKMTRRFQAAMAAVGTAPERPEGTSGTSRVAAARRRWLSPRALLLHLEVLVVAPGCVAAGWWQATRALSGNTLSWVYSVEWPVFAIIAVVVWWHLVHEDPEEFQARRWLGRRPDAQGLGAAAVTTGPGTGGGTAALAGHEGTASSLAASVRAGAGALPSADAGSVPPTDGLRVEPAVARWSRWLAAGIGAELVIGIMAVLAVPFGRPSGWLPARGEAIYVVHAVLGLGLLCGALALVVVTTAMGRMARVVAWGGLSAVVLAGVGGLLTEPGTLLRFFGIALMFVGTALAASAYLLPAMLRAQERGRAASAGAEIPATQAPGPVGPLPADGA